MAFKKYKLLFGSLDICSTTNFLMIYFRVNILTIDAHREVRGEGRRTGGGATLQ